MNPGQYDRVLWACRTAGEVINKGWSLNGAHCPLGCVLTEKGLGNWSGHDQFGVYHVDTVPERLAARCLGTDIVNVNSFADAVDGIEYNPNLHDLEWYRAGARMWKQLEEEELTP